MTLIDFQEAGIAIEPPEERGYNTDEDSGEEDGGVTISNLIRRRGLTCLPKVIPHQTRVKGKRPPLFHKRDQKRPLKETGERLTSGCSLG